MTAAEVRIPHARLIVGAGALALCSGLLFLTRNYTFYFDEWDFILTAPNWTLLTYLQPHNEHPAMLLRLSYTVLLETVGLRTYVPYMTVLLLLHATNVVLVFELVRRRAGDLVGLGASALLVVLGAGWENILWAFQIGWLASVALGLTALLVLQGPRSSRQLAVIVGVVATSLMFSSIGLFFAVATTVQLAASPRRRRDLVYFAPLGVVLAAWYLGFGDSGAPLSPRTSAANAVLVPLYAAWGLGSSAAALIGQGGWFGPPVGVGAALVIAWTWRRRGIDPFALGVAAAMITFYLVTGLTRAQFGFQQSASGRYVYEGALFWLILLADAARGLPWRGTWRPALVACLFLACFSSGTLLITYAAAKTVQMDREVADLQALDSTRGDPCLMPSGLADPLVMPQVNSPALYYRAVDRYGDPAPSRAVTNPGDFARARANLLRSGCR